MFQARCASVPSIVVLLVFGGVGSAGASAQEPTRYVVVVTGGEILSGAFADSHTHFLTRTLRPLGLSCVGSMTVDDGKEEIQAAMGFATRQAELVIVTGGLGPTDNDVTCDALSEFTAIAVEEHAEVLADIAKRFRTPVGELRANLRRQTRVPVGGAYLENGHGTAVGLIFDRGDGVIVAMPGPPRELQPMVTSELIPYLSQRFGTHRPGPSLTVRFVGIGQSSIDQTMEDHVPLPRGTIVSSQFDGSRVDFTFTLPNDSGENREHLDSLKRRILEHLGRSVYATDVNVSLEDVVIDILAEQGTSLSIAEIASGGSVAAALSGAQRSDEVLVGCCAAPDEESLRLLLAISDNRWAATAEGADRTELLARGLSQTSGSQWTLVIGGARVQANGARYADMLLRRADGQIVSHRLTVRGNNSADRARLSTQVVAQLRGQLVGK